MCECSTCLNSVTYSQGEKGDPGQNGQNGENGSSGIADIVSLTSPTKTITELESGTLFVFNRAAGVAATVPSDPADATWYEFEVGTDVTSNAYSVTLTNSSGTELLAGFMFGKKASTADERFLPDGVNDTIISMAGSTTGGLRGTSFRIAYDKPNVRWYVSGYFYGSGVLATPFS